jgi:hypothetical protein
MWPGSQQGGEEKTYTIMIISNYLNCYLTVQQQSPHVHPSNSLSLRMRLISARLRLDSSRRKIEACVGLVR